MVNQFGGLVVVHGYGYFVVGGDPGPGYAGTGYYNLSGGTLNTSEGAGGFTDFSKCSCIGMAGGHRRRDCLGNGLWVISDNTTYKPLFIGCGGSVGIRPATAPSKSTAARSGPRRRDGGRRIRYRLVTGVLNLAGGIAGCAGRADLSRPQRHV